MSPRRGAQHAVPPRVPFPVVVVALVVVIAAVGIWRASAGGGSDRRAGGEHDGNGRPPATSPAPSPTSPRPASPSATPANPPGTDAIGVPTPGPINPEFPGLLTFRGNATRSYYGEGPVPQRPKVLWRYPSSGGLCMTSSNIDGTRTWCGTGWTGQPNVIPHEDGTIEIRIGAYDGHYHFLNGLTGEPIHSDLVTGDLAKGSASSDPDGYPLYYAGSRDNVFRIVAMDRHRPKVLWSVNSTNSVPNPVWNDDWDSAALVIGDYLLEGAENSWFYVIELNRGYDDKGKVTVDPHIVKTVPGWDQELLSDIHDEDISIENSPAFSDGVVYFANSGGLVQGWDISNILKGGDRMQRVFRFWAGDAVDATVTIDDEGYLYVARHVEYNVPRPSAVPRSRRIGDLMKLDPRDPEHPVVWSVHLGTSNPDGGFLATPAIYGDVVYAAASHGALSAVDRDTGKVLWTIEDISQTWSSPVVVDGVLMQGDCDGVLHAYDVGADPRKAPDELWSLRVGGCIESTPAVWHGMIWVGSRDGGIYGIGDKRILRQEGLL